MVADEEQKKRATVAILLAVALAGFAIIIVAQVKDGQELATALMCSLAAIAVGWAVGFLFAIPKTVQPDKAGGAASAPAPAPGERRKVSIHKPNTNLEEVSDWLTKIIVGVGLVELDKVGAFFDRVSGSIARAMAMPATEAAIDAHKPYIAALLVFFVMFGFLAGYLVTRIFLAEQFSQADVGAFNYLQGEVESIKAQISRHGEVESLIAQAEFDLKAAQAAHVSADDKKRLLEDAEAIFESAIRHDESNIPAHIGLSKCYAARGETQRALDKLAELEKDLQQAGIAAIAQGRIAYNRACFHFRESAKAGAQKQAVQDTAFAYLAEAVRADDKFRVIAKNDPDFAKARQDQDPRFLEIVGLDAGIPGTTPP